jgi:hypothetical protein
VDSDHGLYDESSSMNFSWSIVWNVKCSLWWPFWILFSNEFGVTFALMSHSFAFQFLSRCLWPRRCKNDETRLITQSRTLSTVPKRWLQQHNRYSGASRGISGNLVPFADWFHSPEELTHLTWWRSCRWEEWNGQRRRLSVVTGGHSK